MTSTNRIALGISYNGSGYHGWQKQSTVQSVHSVLEKAIQLVANQPVDIVCAGRTDVGVHATEQVVHFDFNGQKVLRPERSWVLGGNANLPADTRVLWATYVPDTFHARFSAVARRYRYFIHHSEVRSALFPKQLTWEFRTLNVDAMQEAANYLIGKHDFSAYRATACQSKSPYRHVHFIRILQRGELIMIDIKANAFLHHMVRNIAGVLMAIGKGEQKPVWAKKVLETKRRELGGVTAPAHGLYLIKVDYPEQFELPQAGIGPIFWKD